MEFKRLFLTENDNFQSSTEVRPKGIIVYSSGLPMDRALLFETYNRPNYRASVHALVDAEGVTWTLPLKHRAWHSGTEKGNSNYLGVVVCEPNPLHYDYVTLRGQTYNNLVQTLVFLSRYWGLDPMNDSGVIQFAGTAYKNGLVASGLLDVYRHVKPHFYDAVNVTELTASRYCIEDRITQSVKESFGWFVDHYTDVPHVAETPLTQIGTGDAVLFIGGELFKSHGTTTRETSNDGMLPGFVKDVRPGSRHAYEVVLPFGTYWANKSSLVRTTYGNISL